MEKALNSLIFAIDGKGDTLIPEKNIDNFPSGFDIIYGKLTETVKHLVVMWPGASLF